MKSKRKALLLMLSAVLLVAASVLGTLAYLTDTEAVKNTFTVGQVGLKLDEAKVDEMGKPVTSAERWQPSEKDPEQEYHLLPGLSYTKDPTVTVDAGSEESYIRMIVTVKFAQPLLDETLATELNGIFTGYDSNKWARTAKNVSSDKKEITYEYRYYTTVAGVDDSGNDAEKKLDPLFTGFTVPGEYTNEQIALLNGMVISVEAHAIQAAGFENVDKAWEAFDAQHN